MLYVHVIMRLRRAVRVYGRADAANTVRGHSSSISTVVSVSPPGTAESGVVVEHVNRHEAKRQVPMVRCHGNSVRNTHRPIRFNVLLLFPGRDWNKRISGSLYTVVADSWRLHFNRRNRILPCECAVTLLAERQGGHLAKTLASSISKGFLEIFGEYPQPNLRYAQKMPI